ncbi:threonine/serine ThrE exporter family protein [Nocardia sp. CA-128927]|uniref:threonine/serine ThrE exporter family protein n=1 Tax=Nocardia sp. CA-128927 TaxID=3239975 RepID=UPI003D971108
MGNLTATLCGGAHELVSAIPSSTGLEIMPTPKRKPRTSVVNAVNGARRPVRQRRRRVTTAEQRRDIALLLRGSIYSGVSPSPTATGDEYSARQVIDFCLDLGEVMLSSGADARSVEVAIVAVSATWNLAAVELDFPGSSIHMVYAVPNEPTIAGLRAVRDTGADLHRLNNVYGVVDDIVGHATDMTQASQRLVEEIRADPRWPYRVVAGAMGVLGIVVALQAGGTFWSAVGAFVLMFVLMYLGKLLGRRYLPTFFVAVAQMALAMMVGSLAMAYSPINPGEAASMVAACVVLLLPHPSIVAAAQDAISGFRSLALVRGLGIGLVVLGMVTGIQAGLISTRWVHLEVDPSAIHLTGLTPLWALFASAIAAAANAFAQGATARVVPISMAAAAFTQLPDAVLATGHPLAGLAAGTTHLPAVKIQGRSLSTSARIVVVPTSGNAVTRTFFSIQASGKNAYRVDGRRGADIPSSGRRATTSFPHVHDDCDQVVVVGFVPVADSVPSGRTQGSPIHRGRVIPAVVSDLDHDVSCPPSADDAVSADEADLAFLGQQGLEFRWACRRIRGVRRGARGGDGYCAVGAGAEVGPLWVVLGEFIVGAVGGQHAVALRSSRGVGDRISSGRCWRRVDQSLQETGVFGVPVDAGIETGVSAW